MESRRGTYGSNVIQGEPPPSKLEIARNQNETTGRLAAVGLTHSRRLATIVDLLFASCGIEREIVESAEQLEVLPGLTAPVASTGHLIAMKLLARDDRNRPADYDDIQSLTKAASDGDLEQAAAAVKVIVDRGYNRGRDLMGSMGELRRTPKGH